MYVFIFNANINFLSSAAIGLAPHNIEIFYLSVALTTGKYNGSEFMAFRSIERALRVPVFFAKPYCSTDKPHVELLNKLIRQYIPKGTSFKDVDDKQIRNIRMLLNNRPRKSLDFKSPNEVLALLLSYRCT